MIANLFFLVITTLFLLFLAPSTLAQSLELLPQPNGWHLVGNNGAAELYQGIPANALNGKVSMTITYNLHGTCILNGDASAIIFDQPGWKYISLSQYGQNCLDGSQEVTIPLSAWPNLDTNANVGTFHTRFWKTGAYTIDVTSAKLNPSPTPSPTPHWQLRSVDGMKYQKDVICAPPSDQFIETQASRAAELGVTHMAVSTPYENPACGNSLTLTTKWVNAIRAKGLKVWHRHMPLGHEAIYNTPKHRSPDGARHLKTMADWITVNRSLIQSGDIFTPIPEPQNGGISGINFCSGICQYSSAADFNEWLRMAQLTAKLAINDPTVKVGYYGFDGFITWGNDNPDHMGTSKIEAATVAAMDNVIAVDHYNQSESMATDLDQLHAQWPNAQIVIGEWGTIFQTTDATKEQAVHDAYGAFNRSYIIGVNYWHLGPGGNESLLNGDLTRNSRGDLVREYFLGIR